MKINIRVQMVLYNNSVEEISKTLSTVKNAMRVANEKNEEDYRVTIYCGDSSKQSLADDSIAILEECLGSSIKLVYRHFGFNAGYGRGHNLLFEDCKEDLLLIMNPDIILTPTFFINMIEPFKDDRVGIVEARQTPVEHQKEYNVETKETEWSSGACFMTKSELFRCLHGFDTESFFMYCEDVDLSWRIRMMGKIIIYQPLAPVFHSKILSREGTWQPSDSEVYNSALSTMIMAHKWSADYEVERLRTAYTNSTLELHHRAVDAYNELEKAGKLPEQIDKEHTVSRFIDGFYTDNRYIL